MIPATHIAIVDDEPDITVLLANYLQSHGYRVTQLHHGRDLMALMPADPPALVLLDLGLPGEDGFVIARQLREHWHCGLVFVTGRGGRAGPRSGRGPRAERLSPPRARGAQVKV